MSGDGDKVLGEVSYRGERWRFTLSRYSGSPRLNVRAFWQAEDGAWRPCSGRSGKGFTMAPEAMDAIVGEWRAVRRSISASGAPGALATAK
jgi:hypothetical protein